MHLCAAWTVLLLFATSCVALQLKKEGVLATRLIEAVSQRRRGVDVARLSLPEVGIVGDFLNLTDTTDIKPLIDFNVEFHLGDKTYQLNSATRKLFNSSYAENVPRMSWKAEEGKTYTVCFVDIDAPRGRGDKSNPPGKQFLMWLVYGVTDPTNIESTGVSYLAPAPPAESTASHRFVFLLCEEPPNMPVPPVGLPEATSNTGEVYINREAFSFLDFLRRNHLRLLAIEYFISPPVQK